MDVQIGRIRSILETAGVRDNTMVWYTADNGRVYVCMCACVCIYTYDE